MLLGPSCIPPRFPRDVAGLESAALPRSRASDDLGRARLDEVGGRRPLPTLAEKFGGCAAADVLLEKLMLLRNDWVEGFREWTADVTVELIAV